MLSNTAWFRRAGDRHPRWRELLGSNARGLGTSFHSDFHGGDVEVRECSWPGTIVIIEFPDRDVAAAWYESPPYQAIPPLRTNNIDGATLIIHGVPPDYNAASRWSLPDPRMPPGP